MSERTIKEVLKRHTRDLMAIAGVTGVAQGESRGTPCIMVFVANRNPDLLRRIPATLEGFPLKIEESSEFRALGT